MFIFYVLFSFVNGAIVLGGDTGIGGQRGGMG